MGQVFDDLMSNGTITASQQVVSPVFASTVAANPAQTDARTNAGIYFVVADPSSSPGFDAPLWSWAFNVGGAGAWQHTGTGLTDWTAIGGGGGTGPVDATTLTLSAQLALTVNGAVNDYAPTGAGTATVWLLQGSPGAATISGIAQIADGRVLVLVNAGATSISFLHESLLSVSANRLSLPDGQTWLFPPGAVLTLRYDPTAQRWRAWALADNNLPRTTIVGALAQSGGAVTMGAAANVAIGSNTSPNVTIRGNVVELTDAGTPADVITLDTAAGLTVTGKITLDGDTSQINGAFTAGAGHNVTIGDASSPTVEIVGIDASISDAVGAILGLNGGDAQLQAAAGHDVNVLTTGNATVQGGQVILDGTNNTQVAMLVEANEIRPAALGATENNYSPAGSDTATRWYLTPAAGGTSLTGIAISGGNTKALVLRLYNVSAVDSLTVPNASGGSTAANQFLTPSAAPVVVPPQGCASVEYDVTGTKWRFIS